MLQTALIVFLSILVVTLATMLYVRIRSEKRALGAKASVRSGGQAEASTDADIGGNRASGNLFKLIRHRNSETLVGKLINEVRKDLDLEQYAYFYPPKDAAGPVLVHWGSAGNPTITPEPEILHKFLTRLEPDTIGEVAVIGQAHLSLAPLAESLQQAGLKYVTSFPLANGRSGLLAWNSTQSPQQVLIKLRQHRLPAAELMANAESFEEVESLSYTDGLTGLANQRYFIKRLKEEIDRARRYDRSMALIIFDLDELKSINDRFGHQAGDRVITQMGAVLKQSIRAIDVVARYGGDEFCIIMPESGRATCLRFMRRLQLQIASCEIELDRQQGVITCTVSQGGAVFPDNAADADQLIYAADMALLKAKEAGRDQFFLY